MCACVCVCVCVEGGGGWVWGLQVVSRVGPFSFWVACLAWDFVNYMIPCFVLLVVFAAFQVISQLVSE